MNKVRVQTTSKMAAKAPGTVLGVPKPVAESWLAKGLAVLPGQDKAASEAGNQAENHHKGKKDGDK